MHNTEAGTGTTLFRILRNVYLNLPFGDGKVSSLELSRKVSQQFAKMAKIIKHNENDNQTSCTSKDFSKNCHINNQQLVNFTTQF